MNTWKKLALGMILSKAVIITLILISSAYFSYLTIQIQSGDEAAMTVKNAKHLMLTKDNFQTEVLESTTPVLVDFWATWCGPCSVIAPVIEEVAGDFEGRAKVGKLDVDEHASIAMKYGIRSIPTLLFFNDGQVVAQLVGVAPKQVIADKLDALFSEEPRQISPHLLVGGT